MDSHKRPRSPSIASSASSSDSPSPPESPSTKIVRSSSPADPAQWLCSLPPSCDTVPSVHSTLASLEAHHRTYHAHVCVASPPTFGFAVGRAHKERRDAAGQPVCGRVFPDERFLQLHLVECHDETTQLRRERGEKVFDCFLATCSARFQTPKGRRLHLIEKHAYPPQYFFAITVWGIEDVLKKGGGMVRRDWTPRAGQQSGTASPQPPRASSEESFGSQPSPASMRLASPLPAVDDLEVAGPTTAAMQSDAKPSSDEVDELAAALAGSSISLVPRSVRLARKAKMPVDT
ncbi:hypothetical protein JCM10908_004927 [Rhodotorula pacifica]|uniref:uncharacterized protein n=1 Tax=Rhodotorula pacifica TaxID=1495444 RepID=UPI00316FD13D